MGFVVIEGDYEERVDDGWWDRRVMLAREWDFGMMVGVDEKQE